MMVLSELRFWCKNHVSPIVLNVSFGGRFQTVLLVHTHLVLFLICGRETGSRTGSIKSVKWHLRSWLVLF